MATINYISETGVAVPDTEDLRTEVESEWRAALGDDLDTAPHTPQGVLITAETLAREATVQTVAQIANQLNPNLAGGVFLDAICALLGLERRGASATRVPQVIVAGLPGTTVPQGSRARSAAGDLYASANAVVLGTGGAATVDFLAVETGPRACPPGELATIVDLVLGWETITNPLPGELGQDVQSDEDLRALRRNTLARQTISTREAQVSGLLDVPGVTSVAYRENIAATTQAIDGVSMVAHSVWACVDGGSDANVAASLLKNKTDGAAWNGAVSVTTRDPWSGQLYAVLFDRPTLLPVFVRVKVRPGTALTNPAATVPDAILTWAAGGIDGDPGLTIGTSVSPWEIAGAINRFYPAYQVLEVAVGLTAVGVTTNVLPVTLKQRAVIDRSYISVGVD